MQESLKSRRWSRYARQLAWFFGLWCFGVLSVTAIGYGIRFWLF